MERVLTYEELTQLPPCSFVVGRSYESNDDSYPLSFHLNEFPSQTDQIEYVVRTSFGAIVPPGTYLCLYKDDELLFPMLFQWEGIDWFIELNIPTQYRGAKLRAQIESLGTVEDPDKGTIRVTKDLLLSYSYGEISEGLSRAIGQLRRQNQLVDRIARLAIFFINEFGEMNLNKGFDFHTEAPSFMTDEEIATAESLRRRAN